MTFTELLKFRRSVRNYLEKPVPVEIIKEMITESTLAPNASNDQPWQFTIVNNREILQRMSDESKQNILARVAANPEDPAGRYAAMLKNDSFNVFYNAPCLVIIYGQAVLKNLLVDCALAASYFMMAATSRGLATCWINLGAEIKDPSLLAKLGIPDKCRIVAPLVLGYPVKIPAAPKRKEPKITRIIS